MRACHWWQALISWHKRFRRQGFPSSLFFISSTFLSISRAITVSTEKGYSASGGSPRLFKEVRSREGAGPLFTMCSVPMRCRSNNSF